MNLAIFNKRVFEHSLLLLEQGSPIGMVDIILWDDEWYAKWRAALEGRFDA